ncbi:hypothetical protein ACFY8X_02305 [Streptomyces tanashiensis]|uniref:hypothetical protein n=1 Tax=Streptomyces tanashiensis TaxID=67367 RepID=UPI00167DB4BB|nr:hypothetical protein [Streptomyces tanashiensis]GGY03478.1 hypothetical protein GCM10010299_02960 [Streptomyces tanashiensis]
MSGIVRRVLREGLAGGRRSSLAATCVEVALGAALTVTVLSQHPLRSFDRLRRLDPTLQVLPDWRLFAPQPVMHDFHLLCRAGEPGHEGEWQVASTIANRSVSQFFWYPERRRDKAFLDLCQEVSFAVAEGSAPATATPAYRILRDYVGGYLAATGRPDETFQFMIMRTGGHDSEEPPTCTFLSPYEKRKAAER